MLLVVVPPLLFFGLLELGLRLFGFGYPTAFLLPETRDGLERFVQNNQFGWRFFGPQLARLPWPFAIARTPSPGTVRIFVLGESAAKGDPRPQCGLPRLLEAMLSLRYPGVRFELVNAAMTAINSHAVLPIACDCAAAGGDIWVIYMGNNEVVGPFGAGTVFGPQTPPLTVIRSALALGTTRSGQLLAAARQRLQKASPEGSEWGGMQMFLGQQVASDDPRAGKAYRHFERNLADILRAGRRHGVGIVVSTVAVNLKDCAPFASAHRRGLSAPDRANWDQFYQLGIKAQEAGRYQEASTRFQDAARLDERFAELRFRQGQCALALGQTNQAQRHFQAARDLDTLRFRCDSRLNDLIRQAAAHREPERILLADAERAFPEHSPAGLPGEDLFYEHVHLTYEGNYLLARTIAERVERLLPERVTARRVNQVWPSAADCARRLGRSDWDQLVAWKSILPRLNNPPFTGQSDHQAQMKRAQAALTQLAAATQPAGLSEAQRICQEALAATPDDPWLYGELASLKQAAGDQVGAIAAARRQMALLPSDPEGWSQLGKLLARQRQLEEACEAFQRAIQLDPQDVVALDGQAECLVALGKRAEALREFRRVLALRPRLGWVWLHLGQLLEAMGRKPEADDCFEKALANPGRNASALVELAGFCQSRGWFASAAENYTNALNLEPSNAQLYVGAGQNLAALRRYAEAARYSGEAVRLAPGFAEAHLLQGVVLGQQDRLVEATEHFRQALQLRPELLDARVNLGLALMNQGHAAEALEQFEAVLRQSPSEPRALKYAQDLRGRVGARSLP
jgi:tetratricopeptide (TPR) repeat protein